MLTPVQTRALDLLFILTPEEAATRLGLQAATVRRWLQTPGFADALRKRCNERREAARRIAAEGTLAAARVITRSLREGRDNAVNRTALDILKLSGIFGPDGSADDGFRELAEMIEATRSSKTDGKSQEGV